MSGRAFWRLFFTLTIAVAMPFSAVAQVADHLECYKVKDAAAKLKYTADLSGLTVQPGCTISVPAKLLCVDTTKTNVAPSPPVDGDGPAQGRVLCYKVKCPKESLAAVAWVDQFGARSLQPGVSKYVCAPELETAGTTTTTMSSGSADVRINEVVPDPTIETDWIELFNSGSATADLTGWTMTDNDPTHIHSFPAGTLIAPGAYLVLNQNDPGSFTFGLGSAGDAVNLYDDAAVLVDTTTWTSGDANMPNSWGRFPNGTGAFSTRAVVTKGAANQ